MQRLINILYRIPKSKLKTYRRFGGYRSYRKMINGNRQMQKAVMDLSPLVSTPDGLPVYFLTGKNYIHQTLFCIRSLLKVSEEKYQFILVDDGTFNDEIYQLVLKKLPLATIITTIQIKNNLQKYLPEDKFPILHHKRSVYPHIKKLTDIHTIQPGGWKLVFDSDMLFWKEPMEIINWLKQPVQPVHMVDCEESYGYSRGLMESLSGAKIHALLNVGVIGLNGDDIKWDNVEDWIKILEKKEGASYYLEQALTAMLIGQTPSTILNKDEYKVNPAYLEFENKANTLHHYVDLSKDIYFKKAWHLIV